MSVSVSVKESLIKAGITHKLVQKHAREFLAHAENETVVLWDLAQSIEEQINRFTRYDSKNPLLGGIAFPTGLSVNECAAHWTPTSQGAYGGAAVFHPKKDIIKVDFGVHLNGYIIDGAFSYTENEELQPLIDCSVEATETGIRLSGAGAVLGDIGTGIQEVIESHEIEISGKVYPVKSVIDLCGHSIGCYRIHSGKAVPNISLPSYKMRMEEGEVYAIETFPSTGSGKVTAPSRNRGGSECSHYMIEKPSSTTTIGSSGNALYKSIYNEFKTLAFCQRHLLAHDISFKQSDLDTLVKRKLIAEYPPLYDVKGSYVAQTEKTILITDNGKTILN
jgi:methionyl aminopeptidase